MLKLHGLILVVLNHCCFCLLDFVNSFDPFFSVAYFFHISFQLHSQNIYKVWLVVSICKVEGDFFSKF